MAAPALAVIIPLLNANEPDARLSALNVAEGQAVQAGEEICTLETTKATQIVQAETSGYVRSLNARPGQTVRAGDLLCYLAASPDWEPPAAQGQTDKFLGAAGDDQMPAGLRITDPALNLAREGGLDLATLPVDILVTEAHVRRLLEGRHAGPQPPATSSPLDPNSLVVYGAGGHGKSVIELIRARGIYHITGVIDDNHPADLEIMGLRTLGGAESLAGLHAQGIRQAANAVGGIGDVRIRIRVFETLEAAGFHSPELVHPQAVIEPSATISSGVQVFPHAYIGSESRLGFGVIVNTGAIVSHDCRLGDYTNISPGAILAGGVEIAEGCLLGMGVTVNLGVRIGAGTRVGNGATVKADVPAEGLVPAGSVWPK